MAVHPLMTRTLTTQTTGRQPCKSEPDAFFGRTVADISLAVEVCGRCPFEMGCRLEGLLRNEAGVWGGLSYTFRHRMGAEGRRREILRLQNLLGQKRRQS